MVMGKAGKLNALMLIVLIFLGFVGIIIIGIFVYGANLVNQTFSSIDITIGDQNFTEVYDETLGKGINVFLDSADNYGLFLLLGMILLMVITSYTFQERQKAWIIIEFVILIIAFIFAVSIQGAYNTVINSSTTLLDIYSVDLIKSSKFILNLPIIIPIVWAFIIILTYGIFRKERRIGSDMGY
jgi:hypothetical protein